MYPSDYGYAVDFNNCSSNLLNYNTNGCYNNDWLYNSKYQSKNQWLLTPPSDLAGLAWFVFSSGDTGGDRVYNAYGVRPVLYLNSEATIESGDGSSSLPYRLSVS